MQCPRGGGSIVGQASGTTEHARAASAARSKHSPAAKPYEVERPQVALPHGTIEDWLEQVVVEDDWFMARYASDRPPTGEDGQPIGDQTCAVEVRTSCGHASSESARTHRSDDIVTELAAHRSRLPSRTRSPDAVSGRPGADTAGVTATRTPAKRRRKLDSEARLLLNEIGDLNTILRDHDERREISQIRSRYEREDAAVKAAEEQLKSDILLVPLKCVEGRPIGDPACAAEDHTECGHASGETARSLRSCSLKNGSAARRSALRASTRNTEQSNRPLAADAAGVTSQRKHHAEADDGTILASLKRDGGQPIGDPARVAEVRAKRGHASGPQSRSDRSCSHDHSEASRRSRLPFPTSSPNASGSKPGTGTTGATANRRQPTQHFFIDESDSTGENSCSEGDGRTRSKVSRTGNCDSTASGSTDRVAVKPPPLPSAKRLQADINSLLGSTKKARTGSGSAVHRHGSR